MARTNGEVRIRSNVCLSPNDWHLVPGDLIKSYALPQHGLTARQRAEMTYFERCCLCHRTVFEIEEDGCDYCAQRGHGTLSIADARQRRTLRLTQEEARQS